MSTKPEPGSRLPDESAKAYEAFKRYRDQPRSKRSIDKVNQAATRPQGGRARASGQIRSYATQFHWVERVREWDEFLDQEERAERLEDARAWRRTKRQVSGAVVAKQIGGLRSANFENQSSGEWIRNWKAVSAIRDESLGITDDAGQATHGGPGTAPFTPDPDPSLDPEVDRFKLTPEMLIACGLVLDKCEYKAPGEPTYTEVLRAQVAAVRAGEDPYGPTVFGPVPASDADPAAVEPASPEPDPADQAADGTHDSRESFP
jgi:hypothetical protein